MKTLDEQIAIMTAYKNGAVIECHYYRSSPERWAESTTPIIWDWANFDFRIKPEPRTIYAARNKLTGALTGHVWFPHTFICAPAPGTDCEWVPFTEQQS